MKPIPSRLLSCLGMVWLALASPASAASLKLNVTTPTSFNDSNRQVLLEWNAEPAKTYLVQSTTNLSPSAQWKTEEALRATDVGPIKWMAPESLRTQKYYRLILPRPEVFSVEPALVNSDDPSSLLYLSGQCLPTNGSVVVNGQNFEVTSFDTNGSWVAFSLNGLPPGTPIIGSILVLDSASNIVTTLPLQNPVVYGAQLTTEQLQGPPTEPPARPDTHIVEELEFAVEKVERARMANPGHVTVLKDYATDPYVETAQRLYASKKGYDYYQAQSHLKMSSVQNNPLYKENRHAGEMLSYGGHVTVLKAYATDPYVETSQRAYLSKKGYDYYQARSAASVSLSSGELVYESTDLAVRGRGLSFEWTRTYRSRTGPTTAQGPGWDFSYNVSLSQQPDGTIVLRPGNGRADTFYPDGTNGWTRDEYFVEIRDLNGDGMPDVLFPDTGKWLFKPSGLPESGKLWKIVDRNGNTITLDYDGAGRLTSIVDTLDRTNTVTYTPAGQIAAVTDFSGRTVRYQYDAQGDLVACISPPVIGTPTRNDFPGGKTNRFTYNSGNAAPGLNHNMSAIIDGSGQICLQVGYHPTTDPASIDFDSVSILQRGTDRKYIWRGSVVPSPSNSFATIQTIVNDYVGNVTEHLFDSRQRCVSLREFTGRAKPGLPTTTKDNRPTGKLRATDPDYFETRWEWNADSLCTREIRPDGSSTEISHQRAQDHNSSRSNKTASRRHDGDVRVLRERASTSMDTDGDGAPDTETLAWYFEYDPRFGSPANARGKKLYVGNLPFSFTDTADREGWDGTIKGSGGISSAKIIMDRDTGRSKGFGFVIASTDPRGTSTTSEYDSNGNCTKSIKQGHYAVSNFHIEVDANYNIHGQLTVITNAPDADGYRRVDTFSYYTSGAQRGMVEVMMAAGMAGGLALATAFEYDPRGNVIGITDPRGNDTRFTYNSLDQCVQTESSSYGGGNGLPPQRISTQFIFDASDNLVRCDVDNRDETGALNSTNPQWSTWLEHDNLNRCTGLIQEISEGGGLPARYATNRFVYDGNDNLVEALSPLAVSGVDPHNTVLSQYDERGLLFRQIAASGSPDQSTTQFDYDQGGFLTRVSQGLEDVPAVTTLKYDGIKYVGGGGKAQGVMGQKAKAWMVNNYEVHPAFGLKKFDWAPKLEGGKESLAWVETVWNKQCIEKDTTVRLTQITDPMGNVTTFHYDRNSNLKVVRHFGESNDVPGGLGNQLLAETRFTYDSFDRCVEWADAFFDLSTGASIGDGRATTSLTYAPNGACSSVTDDNGRTTRFAYDTAGRLASITGPKTNVLEFSLDACGNVTSIVSSERSDLGQALQQFSTVYAYDALNRCITSADNVGNTNRYAYDSRGNLVSHLDPRENEAFAAFDGLSRCVATTHYVGKERGITISTSHVEYDVNSRCVSSTDANGNTTQFNYDSLGRCIAVTQADGTSCSLIWSPRSNLLRQQDANGTIITNSYDLLDRCVARSIIPGPSVLPTTTFETFAYDGFSRCVAASNDVSLTTFAFNSLGHCVGTSQDGLASSATFDGVGNCLSRTYPSGRVVTYTYDALDQVASVSSAAGGQLSTLLAQYAYEGAGRLGRINRANTVSTRVQWNGLVNPPNATGDFGWQQISRVTHARGASGILVDQRTFQHDRSQNTISRVRTQGTIPGQTMTLNYDALDRLTNFARVSGSPDDLMRQYVLDGNGNRQSVLENGVPQSYVMDNTFPVPADFQMNQYTSTPFDTRQHDANGNLVARTTAVAPTYYRYDYADRLVEVQGLTAEGTLATTATYAYDALGRRIRKTINPGPTQSVIVYTLSAESDVLEERTDGTLSRSYVLPEVNDEVLVAFNQAGEPQYYHYDDLGNTLALTDFRGTVLERYEYDDYGKVTFLTSDGIPAGATSSIVGNTYCWGGLRLDSETGLHNDDAGDYYDPLTARGIGLPKITPKISKEHHGKFRLANPPNNPFSSPSSQAAKKGTVKFFNDAKGFGRMSAGGPTKAQDHNSSRSNKTASSMAPGGDVTITVKLIVPIAMDKGLR